MTRRRLFLLGLIAAAARGEVTERRANDGSVFLERHLLGSGRGAG